VVVSEEAVNAGESAETSGKAATEVVSAAPKSKYQRKRLIILGVFCVIVFAVCAIAAVYGGAAIFSVTDRSGGAPIMGGGK